MSPRHTSDISELALDRFNRLCADTGTDKLSLAAVMYAESGWYAKAHNPNGNASGVLQFMPATLKGLGFEPNLPQAERAAKLRTLSVADQMPLVARYIAPHKGKLVSVTHCYIAVFLPADLSKAGQPDYKLAVKGGFRGIVYTANAGFDANRDLAITVRELGQAVRKQCVGPRWSELLERLSAGVLVPAVDALPTGLGTTAGLQQALHSLGFHPGPVDGQYGPRTAMAVKAFQATVGLIQDGIYGPLTRAMLQAKLNGKAAT